ncbi:MAG TPA: hypothetical protein VG692_02795 [Gemmatimonadales bacterium]|nr:hypothetical protein [Gemmatimonadales bacterium]
MSRSRAILALGLMVLVTTCADPTGTTRTVGFGRIAVKASAPPSLALLSPALVLDRVKVVVGKSFPQQEIFVRIDSTTVPFGVTRTSVTASLQVLVEQEDTLDLQISYEASDGTLLFVASGSVIVRPGFTAEPPALQPFYVGPGFNIASMTLAPADSVLSAGDALVFDPQPVDANQAPVTQFYVSWTTDDPRVPIDATGRLVAPAGLTKLLTVTATTPNGVSASTTVALLGTSALGISPDSVEKLPSGTQIFRVTVGALRTSQFVWSVNGVDGGDDTFGTINVDGFYTAPKSVPSPSKFKVCARDAASPTLRDGCAVVVIRAVPTVGADIIVINDENIFDLNAMNPDSSPGNVRFVKNLVNFSNGLPRSSGTVVWYDRGRNSPCFADGECGDSMKATFDSVIVSTGKSITKLDSYTPITSIPSNVKVIIIWMPLIQFTAGEITVLKRFAAEGGRLVFIGENSFYYGQAGLDLQNAFLASLGSEMVNVGDTLDCRSTDPFQYFTTPAASLRSNPLLTGVASLRYVCASQIIPGPNDASIFYDVAGTHLLAGVAKIDVTTSVPLPAPPPVVARPTVAGGGAGTRRR